MDNTHIAYIVLYKDEIIDPKTGRLTWFWFQSPSYLDKTRADDFLKKALHNPGINVDNRRRWDGPTDESYSAYMIKASIDTKQNKIISTEVAQRFDQEVN